MMTLYAVGDIHGDMQQLEMIHARITNDIITNSLDKYQIIHIGDLVDRQFQSKTVIEYLINGHERGEPWVTLKGNHDRMMTLFIDHKQQDTKLRTDLTWLHPRLGGLTTLESYGITGLSYEQEDEIRIEALAKVPTNHRNFLRNLPTHYDTPRAFFTHAGINPEVTILNQTEDDLIWIREPFHNATGPFEKLIVHGHTPVDVVTHYASNRINIDTGAAYGKPLSAIVLDNTGIWQLKADGRGEILHFE